MVTIQDEMDIENIPAGTSVYVRGAIIGSNSVNSLLLSCSCMIKGNNRLCNIYAANLRLDY